MNYVIINFIDLQHCDLRNYDNFNNNLLFFSFMFSNSC